MVLSKKIILVEGDAEYMLVDRMYSDLRGKFSRQEGVHIISVDGTSFKRYMEVAKPLNVKVAIITDNDHSHQKNCVTRYDDHISPNIVVFSSQDDEQYTFEVCVYQANKDLCDSLFASRLRSNSVLDFMLANKTDVALELLSLRILSCHHSISRDAIEWINK